MYFIWLKNIQNIHICYKAETFTFKIKKNIREASALVADLSPSFVVYNLKMLMHKFL